MTTGTRKRLFNYFVLIGAGGILLWIVALGLLDRAFY